MLLAVIAGIAGCAASPAPPAGTVAHDTGRTSPTRSLPARADNASQRSERSERLPQLRLDPGSLGSSTARTQPQRPAGTPAAQPERAHTPAVSTATEQGSAGRAGFVLGDGDVIKFGMFGQPDMATEVLISARGRISLPLVDSVDIGGLTPSQAATRIADGYRAGGYFTDPEVNVTVAQYRSRQISVLGEVNKPGRYPLETRTTVFDALALAEGEKATGAPVITIIRKTATGTRYQHVDTDALVNGGQPVTLNAGDIVYVPEAKRFYIYGEVQKPDAYAIRPGMSVMQAIAVGGGLTERGSNSRIEIRRKTASGNESFRPKLADPVKAGDVVFVKERFF